MITSDTPQQSEIGQSTSAVQSPVPAHSQHEIALTPPKVTTVIKARSGWQAVNLAQLWAYRELLFFLVWRDIKVRYKQTVLGAAWAILQPVMTMIVFSVFFGKLGGMSRFVAADHYPVFVFAGILAWTLFSAIVSQASMSLISSSNMISKIYFPRLLMPLSTAGTALVDFALSLLVMIFLMVIYRVSPSMNLVLLPVFVMGVTLCAIGVGTVFSALVVAYRDFRYVVPFMVQLWMFASPVAYPLEIVPPEWQLPFAMNPVVGMISGFRSCILGEAFRWDCIGISFLTAIAMLLVGLYYFRQVERRFADII